MVTKYKDIYAIESEIDERIIYGVSEGKFAILMNDGAAFCPIHEIPEMAKMIVYRSIREEILGIYEDIKDLRRMRVAIG